MAGGEVGQRSRGGLGHLGVGGRHEVVAGERGPDEALAVAEQLASLATEFLDLTGRLVGGPGLELAGQPDLGARRAAHQGGHGDPLAHAVAVVAAPVLEPVSQGDVDQPEHLGLLVAERLVDHPVGDRQIAGRHPDDLAEEVDQPGPGVAAQGDQDDVGRQVRVGGTPPADNVGHVLTVAEVGRLLRQLPGSGLGMPYRPGIVEVATGEARLHALLPLAGDRQRPRSDGHDEAGVELGQTGHDQRRRLGRELGERLERDQVARLIAAADRRGELGDRGPARVLVAVERALDGGEQAGHGAAAGTEGLLESQRPELVGGPSETQLEGGGARLPAPDVQEDGLGVVRHGGILAVRPHPRQTGRSECAVSHPGGSWPRFRAGRLLDHQPKGVDPWVVCARPTVSPRTSRRS